ncbi:GNAT family N-acetyltransferase [Hymenobacter busanensis]|uniref:GNAT family N-acetyltransferase n=1 Tax=Hymenobacter busanensis TaxID=2607656 RepID=A0A7L5A360_9BACT|nr:GNAT family N-acetyltransferase [Hymenobacter busanensis]KAA9327044.1 GNAT family N-acetyltransferase [Hymenobacter busanensis]QHJ09495.1 GNAT family N-acetyltransferase [Hymenobacter busanensis]
MTLTWTSKPYAALALDELYALLQLRSEVFVVEQACAFQDIDGQDAAAHHLLGLAPDGRLAAYARLFAPGACYAEASIGRVVVSPQFRRSGLGQALMREALAQCERLFGTGPIKIGAQQYLLDFYQSFGFEPSSAVYLEDGIPHLSMRRP